jgi:hypothetical protein
LYVAPVAGALPPRAAFLERAIDGYWRAYATDPTAHLWHGINGVALLARAERDAVSVTNAYPPWRELAASILAALESREAAATGARPAFDVATALEAYIALERWDEAEREAAAYVRCRDADAFELAGTVRQLSEVWDCSNGNRGATVLAILRGVLLQRQGGALTLDGGATGDERRAADAAAGDHRLEALLGHDRAQTLAWYRSGLESCSSVARIETRSGRGFGTGWLVRAGDLRPDWPSETLLVTNKHVISPGIDGRPYLPAPSREALLPHDAVVYLQVHGVRLDVTDVVWTSPDLELDATVVRVRGLPADARPLPVYPGPVAMSQPPSRVYVIGHPEGRDLELSLHDNALLACDDRRLHYRAPTEGGSSGSPVFESHGWRVVALHHAGGRGLPRLDGPGTYDANEGITINALRRAIAHAS